jgi:cell division protein FtsB
LSEKSGRRGWLSVLAAIAILALAYGTFEIGRASAGYFVVSSMLERLDLRKRNQALSEENDSLRHRVAVAEVDQKVDRQAQSDAQQMMGELQAETARQKQELQFYRGLVVRQYGSGALRVQELQVRAEEEERRFLVLITLVQAATRDTVANGTVTFSVEGKQGAEPLTLPLEEIEIDKRKQFPFSLRFFQQIEVPIELPLEFVPERLHVEYQLGRNREPVKQAFDWRVEGAAETPAL